MDTSAEKIMGKEAASLDERFSKLKEELKDVMELSFEEMQGLVNEIGRVQREVNNDYQSRIAALERKADALVVAPAIEAVIPAERRGEFYKAYAELLQRLSEVKTATQAQRVWYGAGDAATQLMDVTGQATEFVHVERSTLLFGGVAIAAAGVAAGFGAAAYLGRRELQKHGRTKDDFRAWLEAVPMTAPQQADAAE